MQVVDSFFGLSRALQRFLPLYERLDRDGALLIKPDPDPAKLDGIIFDLDLDRDGPQFELARQMVALGPSATAELFMTMKVFAGGPKSYRATAEECGALDQVRANVPFGEYAQPFDTFVVELPGEWARPLVNDGGGIPFAVFLCLDPAKRFFVASVQSTDGTAITMTGRPTSEEETVESVLGRIAGRTWDGSLEVPHDEAGYAERCVRLGVNACLLLTALGCRRVGPADPERAAKLEGYVKKRNQHTEANRLELRSMPVLYGFDRHVTLYEKESPPGEAGEPTGRTVAAHWRRGHFRLQRVGPGLTESRRLFIKPVFVNASLFAGRPADGGTTYRRP